MCSEAGLQRLPDRRQSPEAAERGLATGGRAGRSARRGLVIMDKADKIGVDGVRKELAERDCSNRSPTRCSNN
jgi:hypothetical protein